MPALPRKILNVGKNDALLKARSQILQGAGYEVASAVNIGELEGACETHRGDLDLVIIGQALPKQEKQRAMGIVRRFCGSIPILELYPHGTTPVDEEADEELPISPDEADVLLSKVTEVLAKKRKKRRAAS